MLTVIPEGKLLDIERNTVIRLPFTYLYGDIEKDYQTDIFYLADHCEVFDSGENLEEGVYPIVCDSDYCMFYLWNTSEGFHGLVTYTTDQVANKEALKAFHEKTLCI